MLDAGLPLAEALATLGDPGGDARPRPIQRLARELQEKVSEGAPLHEAMGDRPAWFGLSEVAITEAGQRRGELSASLRVLGERQARSSQLASKLAGVLAYPALISLVGLVVVVFLSLGPLPRLVEVLTDSGVQPPTLTTGVIAVGSTLAVWWPLLVAASAFAVFAPFAAARAVAASGRAWPMMLRRLVPSALRAGSVARICGELAAMGRCGVPLVEALRASAATCAGPISASLGRELKQAAKSIEGGGTLAEALDDPLWFSPELTRLVASAEAAGELDAMLDRIATREERRAHRMIDRLAALAEPTVILVLSAIIGVVVMAAALPLVRLRDVLG